MIRRIRSWFCRHDWEQDTSRDVITEAGLGNGRINVVDAYTLKCPKCSALLVIVKDRGTGACIGRHRMGIDSS